MAGKRNIVRFPQPQYESINDALAACGEGDYFVLHPGIYELTETLRITKSLSLLCVDQATGTSATLRYDGGALKPPLPLLRVENGACVSINGLHLELVHDSVEAKRQALEASVAIDVATGSCDLVNTHLVSSTHGLRIREGAKCSLQGGTYTAAFTCIRVSGELVAASGTIAHCHTAISVLSSSAVVTLQSLKFVECGLGLVSQDIHCPLTIDSCSFEKCNLALLLSNATAGATPPSVISSHFASCERGVIIDGEGAAVTLSKNTFREAKVFGLCAGGGLNIIESNRFVDCETGIEIVGGSSELRGNACVKCVSTALFISGSTTRPIVAGNDFAHTTGAAGIADVPPQPGTLPQRSGVAIVLEDGAAPHVDGNAFRKNKINLWVENAFGTVTGNALETSQHDNVILVGQQTFTKLMSNDIQGSARSSGIAVLNGASAEIWRNVIEGSAQAAVYLRGGRDVKVEENEIADAQDAIVVTGQSSGHAANNSTALRTEVFSDSTQTFLVQ